MDDRDRDQFSSLMAFMAEVYGPLSALKIQAYWMALMEFPWRDVQAAAARCLKTRRTSGGFPPSWPTPGDLIALMWMGDESLAPRQPRRALPEPPRDPAVAKAYLAKVEELLSRLTSRVRGVPRIKRQAEPKETPAVRMSEDNWRARWHLYRRDPEYRVLADAIPERLRIKFAEEGEVMRRAAEGGKTDAEKPDPEPRA